LHDEYNINKSKVCKELGISRPTLYNWEKKGIVKFHKIGYINFISDEDRNTVEDRLSLRAISSVL
jgi:predicted site-specific integrase-resolvase